MEQNQPRRRKAASKFKTPQYVFLILIALLVIGIGTVLTSYLTAGLSLELVGSKEVTVEYGSAFTDSGVLATYQSFLFGSEQVEEEVTVSGEVQQDKLGTYTLTYSLSYRGKTAEAKRTVTIVDTQKPVITLVYNSNSFTLPGHTYEEEGFTAEDNYDGDITDKVERMIQNDTVIYRVKDSSGNETTVTRPIQYGDQTPPVLTLNGESTITINAGTKFTDPGYTATDNVDGDITDKVTVTKDFSIYTPGTYTITYSVTDTYGNTATATRTLVIKKVSNPTVVQPGEKTIYLTFDDGPSSYTLELLDILDKHGVKATFFIKGSSNTAYLDDIVNRGHSIGIHTMTHDYKKLYSSVDNFMSEVYECQNLIYEKTGVRTTLLRFPGGSSNSVSKKYCAGIMTELTQLVQAQGFQYFDWNVDSDDAGDAKDSDTVFNNVVHGKGNWTGCEDVKTAIVLQHDIKGYSVKAVDQIITWGLANGYTFKALNSTSPGSHHTVRN